VTLGRDYATQNCSLARTMEVVGERWTLLVVRDLFYGVRRFTDLRADLDIPRAVLAARLATLVDHGVVERRAYRPGRHEYLLTDRGIDLWPAVHALARWGEKHYAAQGPRRVFTHSVCGVPLEPGGQCPACLITPSPAYVDVRPGPGADFEARDDPVSRALRRPHRLLTTLLDDEPARRVARST
jgi:DNA-binding HxlR family transcriptional regulator